MTVTSFKIEKSGCSECPIRHKALCSRCEPDELVLLEDMKSYKTYPAGTTILWTGDQMEFMSTVVTGVASLSQTMEDGRRQMVGLLLPSDFIGHPNRDISQFDVVAATDVTLCRFRRKQFRELLIESPNIVGRLLEMALDELDAAREWMLLLGRKTAREKIASLLAIVAQREAALRLQEAAGQTQFELHLTREAMADYLGLTLETVSRQMSALKREGTIVLKNKRVIVVPNFAKLMDETGDDSDGGLIV